MNTSALKRFSQQARNTLKNGVAKQLISQGYDPKTKQFNVEPQAVFGGALFNGKDINDITFIPKWKALKKAVNTHGADTVAEEAAYTWFNRLMAIQILAKNGYIAPQLSYVSAELKTPIMVQAARQGNAPRLDPAQKKQLDRLLDDDRLETELFTLLITTYCHQNELLQRVFGRMDDYTELLLPADILARNGFIDLINTTDAITDNDYQQVELIGWLYQFYISEKKDEVFKSFKNKKKAEAEDIPAATQIFTPNWIVKYMVQNTVGRLWLDLNPDSSLRDEMKYLVESESEGFTSSEALTKTSTKPIISEVAQIKLLDPASGSGHILVEGFDLLYAMYREEGYSAREAVQSIFTNNLFGLDIDLRAAQLATFALLLKAASYDRTVLEKNLLPHVYAMPETDIFTLQEVLDFLGEAGAEHAKVLTDSLELMRQSQNLGSVMKLKITEQARKYIANRMAECEQTTFTDLFQKELWNRLRPYLQVLMVLTQQYEAVVANPPYMGSVNMNDALKYYVNTEYVNGKADLMTVFMEQVANITKEHGIFSLINMPSWLFLSSFENLRKEFVSNYYFNSLLHFGRGIFGIDFGSVTFAMRKEKANGRTGNYFRLHERNFQHIYFEDIKKLFLYSNENKDYKYDFSLYRDEDGVNMIPEKSVETGLKLSFPNISQSNFEKIPGSPIAYWVSEKMIVAFERKELSNISMTRSGLVTGRNEIYLKLWSELSFHTIGFNCNRILAKESNLKWFPYNKGGDLRKWFGNRDYCVNWQNDGTEMQSTLYPDGSRIWAHNFNLDVIFDKHITWSDITSNGLSFRYFEKGFIFDGSANAAYFDNEDHLLYILAYSNSKIVEFVKPILNPTIHFKPGNFNNLPFLYLKDDGVNQLTQQNISNSRKDWNSRETSWDFERQPLFEQNKPNIEAAFSSWTEQVTKDFFQLHANETELNRIFIDIYGLQDELTPEVKLKDITILQEELDRNALGEATEAIAKLPIKAEVVMSQLISYAMGCIMGRYRLDKPGLHIAHPKPTAEEIADYEYNGKTFAIDDDAIVPLMDSSSSFADNALNRMKHFLELVWGEDELVNSINFLQSALGKDLETYLIKDFWKEHCRRYQKRPIYWLFSSPKGAFSVLTYMHRMNKYTVEKIRSQYLLRHINNLDNRITSLEANQSSLDRIEMRNLEKMKNDLIECREYDLRLKEVADQQIEFDLDDGVVVNYAKFESVVAAVK